MWSICTVSHVVCLYCATCRLSALCLMCGLPAVCHMWYLCTVPIVVYLHCATCGLFALCHIWSICTVPHVEGIFYEGLDQLHLTRDAQGGLHRIHKQPRVVDFRDDYVNIFTNELDNGKFDLSSRDPHDLSSPGKVHLVHEQRRKRKKRRIAPSGGGGGESREHEIQLFMVADNRDYQTLERSVTGRKTTHSGQARITWTPAVLWSRSDTGSRLQGLIFHLATTGCCLLGLAKLGGMCSLSSVSIIEQDNTGSVGATAAHELGHSLSALHDGEEKDCYDEDNYIMSRKLKTPDDELLASRPWQFSPCSVRAFKRFTSE
ncbi:zinc metalloproteinase/disintegrin [Elysia marginata]|uniref:Zinc metalloproteinase/disintegrin n=1 Tax=Elysia marginata TaxID=1093978 RepID=A0AAV4ESQ6_9GAST|nr:zinc metalloproteinase/disintegrin [Elysia marginata]